MHMLRRRSLRRRDCHAVKIQLGADALARDCLLINVSDGGVRLNVEGLEVPDEFVLFFYDKGTVEKSTCRVVWREGNEIGAKFIAVVRQPASARQEKLSA
jgi:PilZ domain